MKCKDKRLLISMLQVKLAKFKTQEQTMQEINTAPPQALDNLMNKIYQLEEEINSLARS